MNAEKKYKILVWMVVILFAINISTVVSLYVHTKHLVGPEKTETIDTVEIQADRGARQFRDYLGLNATQMSQFRDINRDYNQKAGHITRQLEYLRIDMINELGNTPANMEKIGEINSRFGRLHEQLKNITAEYYLEMKEICNEDQQLKLYGLFKSMVQTDEPAAGGAGRRRGRGWRGE